jgi:hypothetical protein
MDDTLLEIRCSWSSSGKGWISTGGGPSLGLVLFLKSPRVEFSCLIGTRCPVTGCLTPAQTLHVRPANYRRSCCCALALHALEAHGGHGVTTFETAAYQLWWLVIVLGRGMEPLSVLDSPQCVWKELSGVLAPGALSEMSLCGPGVEGTDA